MSIVEGSERLFDRTNSFSADNAAIRQIISRMGADQPVKVIAVRGEGLNPVGYVDVQPMVHMVDGSGKTVPHDVVRNVPYIRLQGGISAVICDPAVGDNGFVMISGRDITNVKATKAPSPPGTFRQFDFSDAVYVGGILNGTPQEYVHLTGSGITIHTPNTLQINAASVEINCNVTVNGDVTANGISLDQHVHGGVQGGSGSTGRPVG